MWCYCGVESEHIFIKISVECRCFKCVTHLSLCVVNIFLSACIMKHCSSLVSFLVSSFNFFIFIFIFESWSALPKLMSNLSSFIDHDGLFVKEYTFLIRIKFVEINPVMRIMRLMLWESKESYFVTFPCKGFKDSKSPVWQYISINKNRLRIFPKQRRCTTIDMSQHNWFCFHVICLYTCFCNSAFSLRFRSKIKQFLSNCPASDWTFSFKKVDFC